MLSRFSTLGGVPTDPYWANVAFLLVGNGANGTTTNIKDSSSNNLTTTAYGATISNAQSKFNTGSSVYFNGSTNVKAASSTLFKFGTGDFTVEAWVYPTAYSGESCLLSTADPTDSQGFTFNMGGSGNIIIAIGNGSWVIVNTSAGTISLNSWQFIVFQRAGNVFTIYVNGSQTYTVTNSVSLTNTNNSFAVGGRSGQFLTGYMYDVRVTKGVARYSGSTMTVPTAPMPLTGP
jgi:hypothetical protein